VLKTDFRQHKTFDSRQARQGKFNRTISPDISIDLEADRSIHLIYALPLYPRDERRETEA
jgi:hypothetical protein